MDREHGGSIGNGGQMKGTDWPGLGPYSPPPVIVEGKKEGERICNFETRIDRKRNEVSIRWKRTESE